MAYEVITHGGGDGLVYVFNAISAMFNGAKGFGSALVYIAGSFATAMSVMTLVIKQELLPSTKWLFGSLVMMMALMLPKVDIIVKDRISRLEAPVANVPFMLGAFAGIASQLGDIVAEKFDSLFSKAGGPVMDYRQNGVAMASRLAAKASNFTIPNPDMAANTRAFVQNCMVFDIAKGKYSLEELLNAKDTWAFLAGHASPIRGFPYRVSKKNTKILTCREAVVGSEAAWKAHIGDAAKRYGSELFPYSKKPAMALLSNLEVSYQYLTGLSVDAASILKQNMMRNAIQEGLLELNQLQDASAAINAYALTRAEAQQKTAYALQGNMASLSLSTLKIVVEVLFYGIFPIIVAIAVFPGGVAIVKKYLIALFWIQSWAPMYSILNMLVNVYGKVKSTAAITLADGSGALAFSTIPRLGEANEWVSAVAGYAMMSVPFLSYGIIHYGAGALSQLASQFGGITQSASSQAAEEATTGNYQMGNLSLDNHNRNNVNAFKQDTNMSVAAGKQTVQNLDGSILNKMPNNEFVLDKRPTISELGASFNESSGVSTALNRMAEQSHREGMSHLQSSQEHMSSALNKYQGMVENYRNDKSMTNTWAQGESVMKDSALSKLDAASKELSDGLQIDVQASNQLLLDGKLGLGGSAGVKIGMSGTGIGADVNANANVSLGSSHREDTLNTKQQKILENIQRKYDVQSLLKRAESESKEGRYAMVDASGNQYDTGIRAHLDEGLSQQKMAQASFAKEEAYRESAQFAESSSVESTQNLSQQVFNHQVGREGVGKALEKLSSPERTKAVRGEFISGHASKLEEQFEQQAVYKMPEALEQQYQQNAEQAKALNNPQEIYQQHESAMVEKANNKGLTKPIESDMPEQFETASSQVQQQIQSQQQKFDKRKNKMETRYQEFSEDNRVNDYSTKFKNLAKDKRTEKSTGKLDDD